MAHTEKVDRVDLWSNHPREDLESAEKLPYIYMEKRPEEGDKYYALFGLKVVSLIDRYSTTEKLSEIFNEQVRFLQCLLDNTPDQTIELRYACHPDRSNWAKGRIAISLIAKNLSSSQEEAYSRAVNMSQNLSTIMAMETDLFETQFITDPEEFHSRWFPFEIRDVVEIVRREEKIPIGRHESFYIPCPFIPRISTWANLCKGLLLQKEPVVYSVIIQSTTLTDEERGYMENPVIGKLSNMGFISPFREGEIMPDERESMDTSGLDKTVYLMKINIASSGHVSRSLMDVIGNEITFPSYGREVRTGLYKENQHRGGYAWYRPGTIEGFRQAVNHLKFQKVEGFAPTIAPPGMKRIRYLFDPVHACSAFRLPVVADGKEIHGLLAKNHLPAAAAILPDEGILLGINQFGEARTEIRLNQEERRKHCYIQGATGMGKTTLILNMALEDIEQGKGVTVVDYHGDLSVELLKRLPRERIEDLIYFNPADMEYPVGFNPLEHDATSPSKDLQKENIVSAIFSWLQREYQKDHMGPSFFQNVRNGLLLVMSDGEEPATIIDFVNIFMDKGLMEKKLERLKNPMVRRYWEDVYNYNRYKNVTDNGLTMLQYILCKFSPLVDSELTRNIFSQRNSSLNFREILDTRKILICNFSKGLIGESNARFFGLMILSKLEQAALSRADIPEDERVDNYLYLDECQNVHTEHFYNLLSEMRKYRINITLANQHFSQLDERMRDAIIGNCSTMIIFKTGIKDAGLLEPMFYPLNKQLFLRLSNYQAAVRMHVKGEAKTVTMNTLPLRFKEDRALMEIGIEMSRLRYGTEAKLLTKV